VDGTENVYRRLVLVVLVATIVLAPLGTAVATVGSTPGTGIERADPATASGGADPTRATITAVYPDPVTDGDRGECVVVDLAGTEAANLSLSDGEDSIPIPDVDGNDRVCVSDDPGVACRRIDARSIAVEDMLDLSNAGETLTLRADGTVASRVSYGEAQSAHWYRNGSWHPLGGTDFDPVTVQGGTGRVFVLPDSPGAPVAPLRNASDRILLAGYSFASERVTRTLRSAVDRGVRVRVLLDGAPVGGLPRREARLLDRLVDAGVDVRMLGGPRARYAFHHAKYAVVDDRAVVLTENWKPAGVGGRSSRGWGVVLGDPTAARLARVFRADATAPDAIPWTIYRTGRNFSATDGGGSTRTYPVRFGSRRVPVDCVEVFVAPDNAGRGIRELLRSANESIRVVQMTVDGRNDSFLQATLAAARRGVRVEILLSRAWYVREENRKLVRWLRRVAERENLPLAARLTDPRSSFEKVHAKGIVVDGDIVVVGSLNWNGESRRRNREVLVAVYSREAARFFGRVFRSDWRGGAWRVPIAFGVAVALVCFLAVARLGRWISFDQSP